MISSRSVPLRAVAGVAIAALALTGCSNRPSDGVRAGESVVSMKMIDQTTKDCAKYVQNPNMPANQVVATALAQGAVADEVLRRTNRSVSHDELTKIGEMNRMDVLIKDPKCRVLSDSVSKLVYIATNDGQDKTLKEIHDVDVNLNPRLGQWDPQNVVAGGVSSLSEPWSGSQQ